MQQAQRTFPCAPSTSRGRALLLGTDGRDVIAYGNGRSVVLFNVRTKQADAFHEHTAATTVARFSPDGLLVASGDASGRVLVWSAHDTKQKSSLQLAALSSAVNDLQWAPDAKTLLVCGGDGRGRSAAAFSADKGALLGTLSGLARPGNSLDVSAGGRVVTGDDAGAVNVFDACVPFKHRFTVPDMSGGRAVNCVRFAPNSSTFSVAGKAALLYAGDGVPPTPLVGHATGSSVFCSAWSADGAQLLTSGADKTVRLWDATAAREVGVFDAGKEATLNDTQVGCAWLGADTLVSVALSGDVRIFDRRQSLATCTLVVSHQRAITAVAAHHQCLTTADYSGQMLRWSLAEGCATRLAATHANSVVGAAMCGTLLVTCGLDDRVCWSDTAACKLVESIALPCAPKALGASSDGLVVIATVSGFCTVRRGGALCSTPLAGASAVAVTHDGQAVVIGSESGSIHFYSVSAGVVLQPRSVLSKHRGAVTALAFDSAGAMLASCDANREVVIWERAPGEPCWAVRASVGRMLYHTARVACLAWSPDGQRLASAGLDCSIIVWSSSQPASKRVTVPAAHRDGVTALCFSNDSTLFSAGSDACVRTWTLV